MDPLPFWCFQSVLLKYASFVTIVATYSVKNTDLSNCLGKAPRWRAVCFDILWSLLSPQHWIVALFEAHILSYKTRLTHYHWGITHFYTYTIYKISSNSHLFSPIHNGRPLLRIPPRNSDPSDSKRCTPSTNIFDISWWYFGGTMHIFRVYFRDTLGVYRYPLVIFLRYIWDIFRIC